MFTFNSDGRLRDADAKESSFTRKFGQCPDQDSKQPADEITPTNRLNKSGEPRTLQLENYGTRQAHRSFVADPRARRDARAWLEIRQRADQR